MLLGVSVCLHMKGQGSSQDGAQCSSRLQETLGVELKAEEEAEEEEQEEEESPNLIIYV